jgi:cytochrome c5
MRFMSDLLSLLVIVVLVILAACNELRPHAAVAATTTAVVSGSSKIDFDTQLKPIFEQRCQPCHFSGGKVYAQMPFDRAETIKRLGTKLFTRIKDAREQELIRQYLAQKL